ncbi:MAG: SAM-dependent methyltransferase [Chitinophagia bacterium]|nr:SAM-dependent methyltransferase [Chitinophagia bacterium]
MHFLKNMLTTKIGTDNDLVRANWVISELKLISPGSRLLDAGAGELRFKPYCTHLEYIAQDFGNYDGEGDGKGLQTERWDNSKLDIISDITSIPLPENSVDAILCTEVFEHIPDAIAALKEFTRLLKPGGILLITAPFCSLTHFAPYHFSGYNRYWYQHHLDILGYQNVIIEHNGSWFSFIAQELRRSYFVSKMYSEKLIGRLLQVASIPLLILLHFANKRDKGSNELLCFGYMVKAVKGE